MFFRKKGFSVAEVIVTVAIFSTFFAIIFMIFMMSSRTFRTGKDKAEIQGDAIISMSRMRLELSCTDNETVTVNAGDNNDSSNPPAISFMSPYNDTGMIEIDPKTLILPLWQKYIIYYFNRDTNALMRKEDKLGTATVIGSALSIADLKTKATGGIIVARNIKSVYLSRTSPYMIKIEIRAAKKNGIAGQNKELKYFIEVFPHNNLNI